MKHPTPFKLISCLIIFGFCVVHPSFAYGQENSAQPFEVIAQMGGPITDSVAMPDGTILTAEGSGLIRLTNTFGPLEVIARQELNRGIILALISAPPFILVLTEDGLLVLPNTAEGIPAPLTFLAGGGQSMVMQGDLIAVASRESGLRLIRFGTNGSLAELSHFILKAPSGEVAPALDVTLSPDLQFAYIATGAQGVQILDIRDPGAPIPVGALPGVTPAEAITMIGDLLAIGSEGRVIMADPIPGVGVVGTYAPLRNARRIVVEDGYAYIADEAEGVKILWLTAPDRPLLIYGEVDHPASDLALVGNYLFVAGHGELRVLDISSRYRPLSLGYIALDGIAEDITIEVNDQGVPQRAFIAMGEAGAAIVDVRSFALPTLLRQIVLDGPARAVHYMNGVLYAALDAEGLALIDASEFGAEQKYGTVTLPGRALDLEQRGSTLFVAAGQEGILALDVFYAYRPKLVGTLPLEALNSSGDLREASSISISGKRAYVADGDGFTVVDISFPNHMGKLARIDTPSRDIGIDGIYLYATGASQIGIYDARATAEPVALRQYRALSQIAHLTAEGTNLFATSASAGPDVVVIDVSSPDAPSETSSTGLGGDTIRLRQAGSSYLLAAGLAGLRRFQLSEGGALIPQGSYAPVSEALVIETQGGRLLVGGQQQWSMLDTATFQASNEMSAENLIDIAALGDRAAALSHSRLDFYDLSLAEGPLLIAAREIIGGASVEIDSNYIYVAGSSGLVIYEQSALLPIAEVRTPFPAIDLIIHESVAYLAMQNGTLAVIDLGDPTGGIVTIRSISTRHPTRLIANSSGTIYGLADELLIRLFTSDLSRLGVLEDGTLPLIAPDGFFADHLFGLFIPGDQVRFYNVADLENGIAWDSAVMLGAEAVAANATNRTVFAAYGEGGLVSVPRFGPQTPTMLDSAPSYALLIDGNTLFAAGDSLSVWDISEANPQKLSSIPLTSHARHIDQSGETLLVSMEGGLSLMKWDGSTLSLLGTLPTPPSDRAEIFGERIYIALNQGGLLVSDWAEPTRPSALFTYISSSGQFVHDLLKLDEHHLLVSWENGIDALDVSSPANGPHLRDFIEFGALNATSLSMSDDSSLAALSQGDAGILLIDLTNPNEPNLLGTVETPGRAGDVLLDGQNLFVADGQCGLRVYNVENPRDVQPAGAWRDGYVAAIAESGGVIFVGSGNRLYGLRYNASAPPVSPPESQIPSPANASAGQPLETVLRWEPAEDICDPLTYDVFFGIDQNPPYIGSVTGEPILDLGKLEPERTYSWRVEAVDTLGNRSISPVWSFTTVSGTYPDTFPPAPPPFLEAVQKNPMVPMGLATLLLVLMGIGVLYWRGQHPPIQEDIPEWYSTQEEEVEDS